MKTLEIQAHAEAIATRGYTIIPGQVGREHLAELNAAADRALDAVSEALAAGVKPAHTELNPFVRSARCFYTWAPTCLRLLEHDTLHALGNAVLGAPRLWDMAVLEACPMPTKASLGSFDWHRDFPLSTDDHGQGYMWVFVCLTDVTNQNGATWVIPGTHRDGSIAPPHGSSNRPPSAMQLTASAGDIIAINPVMLHSVGENRTLLGRRLALMGLCRRDLSPLLNHWSISESVRAQATERTRTLLYTDDSQLDVTWDVLPAGWPSARLTPLKRAYRQLHKRSGAVLKNPGKVWAYLRGANH